MIEKDLKRHSAGKLYSGGQSFKSLFIHKDGTKSYSVNKVYERRVVKPIMFDFPKWTSEGSYEDRIMVKEFELIAIMYDMIIYKEI